MTVTLSTGTWIEPDEPVTPPPGSRPAYQLRHEFELPGPVAAATVQATAHGIYELFVNGTRVGDLELTPGFTAYRSRLQVQSYDVADLLRAGGNAIEVLLSDGWFRGRHGFARTANGFGDRVAALLALEVTHPDGTVTTVGTGPGWWSRPSRITAADLMDGQQTDLRQPASGWRPARPVTGGLYDDRRRLHASDAPPVRRIQELRPVAVDHLPGGATVIDFGQNINGWVRLSDLGPAGCRLTLTHGEHRAADGRVDTDHLRAFDVTTGGPAPAGQVDRVVSAGRAGDVFEPRHTTHGFRYVQIDGHPGRPVADAVTAVVVHTDLATTGRFRCSDDRLDALHEAAVWSFRGNACDIPTDCPQRERSGFTGDWQVYVATAALTHDVAAFSGKWLRDLAADQWPDGRVPTVTPNPAGPGPSGIAFMDAMEGSAGWGDAAVLVPWELWRAYGDRAVLERQYDSMVRWVGYAATAARTRRHPDRAAARPRAAAHEQYLWDTGGHFGEWLEPGETPRPDPSADHGIVATAYLARSAHLLGRIAALLGRTEDAARHRALAAAVRDAWQREYLAEDGRIAVPTQANHVRALAFDLVPAERRAAVADRLAALIAAGDHHLGTGFLSTGMLLPVLADTGHLSTAYRVLLSTGVPSWLEMIDRGATTIWERWDGVTGDRAQGSLNHYSKGAVVAFLHTHVAGIRLPADPGPGEAGYRRFVIQPRPGGELTWAQAEHDSPYGLVRSAWRLEHGRFRLDVEIPAGTRAEVRLPDGRRIDAAPGRHCYDAVPLALPV
ncbi:family 78 glycoside hydrolase catalytic domain [Actinoplanes sp. URMC 104]|uniref:family 78 glycoside hydrolase catalytic domain n=1 Tax=Actinoplanes sp. URMC 104 TaxID=3423409 RepID=UPI003F19D900